MRRMAHVRDWGGKFVVPIPTVSVTLGLKILVTGTEGYIGARMAPILSPRARDHRSRYRLLPRRLPLPRSARHTGRAAALIYRDLRTVEARDLEGFDAVVTSQSLERSARREPAGGHVPDQPRGLGAPREAARQAGVRRFVYASSCSVYGFASSGDYVDETSPTNPQTAYASAR